ncbi:transcription termination factor Rho [Pedococcus dokdonensis]|uniref:Transcription termination factor Rho n=1 Tax=Pedococcus dokdonensis TaxID=443156 RepID=A0A1H0LCE5_9MICO|nr:transcription termination factor Rho [Pedococcus dokdonensis]SDO65858.1 transcription termination factor Rho [Pedococcus dokdonensis]
MTDTTTLDTAGSQDEKPRRSGALSTMKVAELQGLAASMGITGTAKMRKGDLVTAIKDRQSGTGAPTRRTAPQQERPARAETPAAEQPTRSEGTERRDAAPAREASERSDAGDRPARTRGGRGQQDDRQRGDRGQQDDRQRGDRGQQDDSQRGDRGQQDDSQRGDRQRGDRGQQDDRQRGDRGQQDDSQRGDRQRGDRGQQDDSQRGDRQRGDRGQQDDRQQDERNRDQQGGRTQGGRDQGDRNQGAQDDRDQSGRNQTQNQQGYDDDGEGRGGRRRNRNRNRNRDKRGQRGDYGNDYDSEPMLEEDDVLVPVAGILDVLDNYAFVRTSGYLPGPGDVYVPLGMVKKNGMRKGDAVTGAVKAQREDAPQNQRQKFNALVRLDTVNGMSAEDARKRIEFGKLTPLYPQQRLRLETDPSLLTTRVIDLVAPIGKGQRGLIVAPAKAGKTMVMQAIANAITTNNPECHLMVVLVDERPEEVTDMQRAVKGEVISSTFDRPAEDHTTVAELAIERAKRLVEMGHDVVVLLDSITKLGRAYNLAAPASGRILSGGVDSAALYPPKKFFGAARNIENGGSLTILATALVETGSRMDEVIFEEFKGTGNMELKLDRGLANRRIFPAVDINNSGTRKEEILLSGDELKIMWKLRRVLAALDQQQGIELLIDRLKKTKSNIEFLMQVQQSSSIRLDDDDRD